MRDIVCQLSGGQFGRAAVDDEILAKFTDGQFGCSVGVLDAPNPTKLIRTTRVAERQLSKVQMAQTIHNSSTVSDKQLITITAITQQTLEAGVTNRQTLTVSTNPTITLEVQI